jgi:hypothetical protein
LHGLPFQVTKDNGQAESLRQAADLLDHGQANIPSRVPARCILDFSKITELFLVARAFRIFCPRVERYPNGDLSQPASDHFGLAYSTCTAHEREKSRLKSVVGVFLGPNQLPAYIPYAIPMAPNQHRESLLVATGNEEIQQLAIGEMA